MRQVTLLLLWVVLIGLVMIGVAHGVDHFSDVTR